MRKLIESSIQVLKGVQARREVSLQTGLISALYAAQACLSVFVILHAYQLMRIKNPLWAVVSAVLILQPGINQSLANSLTRVVANAVGMAIGALVELIHGHGALGLCEGLIAVIVVCEVLRLDAGLRTACATLLIVMMPGGFILGRGAERVQAVAIGCACGVAIQLLTSGAFNFFGRLRRKEAQESIGALTGPV